jgi:phosphotransferase system  glucose/maltose/N-acetylglucosamine-specific IIC component
MEHLYAILIGIAALGVFVWLLWPTTPSTKPAVDAKGDEILDASNSRQIGFLIGMMGGDVADAAVARFALQRFEEIHGRKATTRDVGIVVGLMSSLE